MTSVKELSEMEFTKDTVIGEVIALAPQTQPLFLAIGMHCLGCAMSSGETIEQACRVHDVDAGKFIEILNRYVREHPLEA